jgi:beta-fructofuranosidase
MERVGGGFSTWYVVGDSLEALWNISHARPFVDEPQLFAAPLTQLRDGTWAFVGFLNQEAEGIASFELIDPIRLTFRGGELRRA